MEAISPDASDFFKLTLFEEDQRPWTISRYPNPHLELDRTNCDHMRFFFNLRYDAQYERDVHGLLLPNIDAAITAALYRQSDPRNGDKSKRNRSRRCEITDAAGKILALVPAER